MGPRARRRLVTVAIAVALVAGSVAATVALTRPSPHHAKGVRVLYGTFGAFGIKEGMRSGQVLARFGPPDVKANGCWTYRIRNGRFRKITLIPQIARMDGVRYCFFDGLVTSILDHYPGSGNSGYSGPYAQPWAPPLTWLRHQ